MFGKTAFWRWIEDLRLPPDSDMNTFHFFLSNTLFFTQDPFAIFVCRFKVKLPDLAQQQQIITARR